MQDKETSRSLGLCRMSIEEIGANPEKLATEIHRQLKPHSGRVPVRALARELDISEIRMEPLDGFEGAVIMTPSRSIGSILINQRSGPRRKRFTIAHELCHFLNLAHKPRQNGGFRCEAKDVYRGPTGKTLSSYRRQEAEANRFAGALLMPKRQLTPYIKHSPNLEHIKSMADIFDVSKQAAVHRYVACRDGDTAIAICQNGKLVYWVKPKTFPRLKHWNGDVLPMMSRLTGHSTSDIIETEPSEWLEHTRDCSVNIQILWQDSGYAMTMVEVFQEDEPETDGLEDTFERFSRRS